MAGVPSQAMRLQLVCLLLCQALRLYSAEFTHDRKRLGPLESVRAEHGCLEKFEVSESTIIRTQDSRVLGAKFLNESDVGNREDCLTLCCATHLCNVAVFEEKGSGSCYLFDCGPPGDFKCKFTGHTFYTSAVLKVNRHQLELGLWSEQSQHEAELANLRSSGEVDDSMGAPDMRHAVPTTVPTPPPKVTIPTTTTTTTSTTVTPAAPTTTTTTTTAKTTLPLKIRVLSPRHCECFEHVFTVYGEHVFTVYGEHVFTVYGEHVFTVYGEHVFTVYGEHVFTVYGEHVFTVYGEHVFTVYDEHVFTVARVLNVERPSTPLSESPSKRKIEITFASDSQVFDPKYPPASHPPPFPGTIAGATTATVKSRVIRCHGSPAQDMEVVLSYMDVNLPSMEDNDPLAHLQQDNDPLAHLQQDNNPLAHLQQDNDPLAHLQQDNDPLAHLQQDNNPLAHLQQDNDPLAHLQQDNDPLAHLQQDNDPLAHLQQDNDPLAHLQICYIWFREHKIKVLNWTSIPLDLGATEHARKCSRFQFECHSGECIAIYNACDGIPQCQDNSDEDPALGCPPASTEGVVAAARRPGDETGGGDQGQTAGTTWDNPGPAKNDLSSSGDVWQGASRYPNSGQGYPPGIFSRRPNILDTYSPYQPSGGPQDDSQVYGGRSRAPSGYYDYNQRSAWAGPMYNGGDVGGRGDHYMGADGHRAFHYPDYGQPQQQPQQQQQQQLLPPMQQPQISNNPVWMDKPNYPIQQSQQQLHQQIQDLHQTPSVMQHQQLQQQQLQQQQQVVGQQPAGPYQLPPTLEHQHNAASIQANIQGVQMDMTGGTSRQIPANSEVLPPMPKTSTSTMAPLVTPSTGMTTTNGTNSSAGVKEITAPMGSYAQAPAHAAHDPINTVAHASLARLEVNLEELEMQAREQDAQASGAVLALAMGVCITALLVVLVGCRLRGVRRRLRRHRGARSPYAHDADYLVNGMYL
nr:uncharacterized protein LOC123753886 [Procambarus clarkii]